MDQFVNQLPRMCAVVSEMPLVRLLQMFWPRQTLTLLMTTRMMFTSASQRRHLLESRTRLGHAPDPQDLVKSTIRLPMNFRNPVKMMMMITQFRLLSLM